MKRRYNLLAVLLCMALFAGTAFAQLTGTKTIGPSGDYANLTAAIGDLNTNGVGAGGVIFVIASGSYTEPGTLTINPATAKPSAANQVKFTVENGGTVTVHLPGSSPNYSFTIGNNTTPNYVDYITVDGWNGTGRGLTIINDGPDGSNGILVFGDNNTFKNMVYAPSAAITTVGSIGIMIHDANASDNCVVDNCDITSCYGVMVGSASSTTQVGTLIQNNTIHCVTRGIYANRTNDIIIRNNEVIGDTTYYPVATVYGVYVTNSSITGGNVLIDGNTIHKLGKNSGSTASQTVNGIYVGSKSATYTISRNKIYGLYNATSNATSNVQVQGIATTSGDANTKVYIVNNFIYGLEDNDADASTNWTAAIRPNTDGKAYVYHNTVFVKHTTRNHATAAFICGGPTGALTTDTNFVFNNIFYVDQSGTASYKSFCLYRGGSFKGVLISDYNLLVNNGIGTQSVIGDPNGNTLAAWQLNNTATLPTPDLHSVNKQVVFADSVSDLHLAGASIGDLSLWGTPLAVVTTDIDGETRSAVAPYMGADEIAGQPLPVELNSFTARATQKGVVLAWSTATEVNNRGFEIERRAGSNADWQKVGFVAGAGTSNAAHQYSYSDQAAAGTYTYRLKQMDNDGAFKYSTAVEVLVGAAREFKLYGNYPNPFNPSTAIRFTVAQDGQAEMKVFNALGQEVATIFNGFAQAGKVQEASFNAASLPSGMYFARLKSGNAVSVIKMMLMK